MQYLDKATGALRTLGLMPEKVEEAPINALLQKSPTWTRSGSPSSPTLGQASVFNEVVREQTEACRSASAISRSPRFRLHSRRRQSDGRPGRRRQDRCHGTRHQYVDEDLARRYRDRFDDIRGTYLDVTRSTLDQIERETTILDAYRDFRGALKQAEVLALEVLQKANAKLEAQKAELSTAADKVANFAGTEIAERARLELVRDEQLRRTQDEEKRYQIAKDLSDNLTVSYNTSEVIMARLLQTTNAKERVYAQAVSFFSTNDSVLTALKASFTGMFGLHEATQSLDAMKEGVSKSLEVLAEIGDQVGEAAVKSGYGPTIRADAVRKLVDSVVNFQVRSLEIVDEMRKLSTQNSAEIRDAVEEGKQRITRLVAAGEALPAGRVIPCRANPPRCNTLTFPLLKPGRRSTT
jgi:hypothetical protein